MVGLKPANGGSIPPFLVSFLGFERRQAAQMYGKEGGSRVVILRLFG